MNWLDLSRDAEERRLARTLAEVRRQLERLRALIRERRDQVVETRTFMWQELPNIPRDWDEIIEFTQHRELLGQQERDYVLYRDMIPRLERMENSPYFGRIDFVEAGSSRRAVYYIGIAALVEEATGEHLVYDWRAPVSSMFYDFEPGPAHYTAAGGKIHGELLLKRQYRIQRGRLEYLFDTDLKIDDDILQDMLGKNVDRRMRAIVQSIQREQNRVIRDEAHRLLIVQGPAGSGKTSIALHRVAYFLYRYRGALSSENIAVLSPNEIFTDYISGVLPELGEENMRQFTLPEIAAKLLPVPPEGLADQLERLLTSQPPKGSPWVEGIAFKGSPQFLEILNRYVKRLESGAELPLSDIEYRGQKVIDRGEMLRLVRDTYSYLPYVKRLEKLARRILYLIEPLQQQRLQEVRAQLEADPDNTRATRAEIRRMSRAIVQGELQPLHDRLQQLATIDTLALYLELFRRPELLKELAGDLELPAAIDAIARATRARLENGEIAYEDVAPLLYLKAALGEAEGFDEIRHVVVDEVQDYSAVHFAAMRRLFSKATFTLLGDVNQAIHPYLHAPDFETILKIFAEPRSHVVRLTKSYRNTRQIAAFAKGILTGGSEPAEAIEPIERDGPLPLLIRVQDEQGLLKAAAESIRRLQEAGCETIAVICRTAAESRAVYDALSAVTPLWLVTKDDRAFRGGTLVIPSYLAKGLEFDGVVVYDAGAGTYHSEAERKLLYTVCTRALHHLVLGCLGEPSPLLAAVDPQLYAVAATAGAP